jgi:hypothetical protein
MAPCTMERTPFQKDCCTNARSVIHRELLDIEDEALHVVRDNGMSIPDLGSV